MNHDGLRELAEGKVSSTAAVRVSQSQTYLDGMKNAAKRGHEDIYVFSIGALVGELGQALRDTGKVTPAGTAMVPHDQHANEALAKQLMALGKKIRNL